MIDKGKIGMKKTITVIFCFLLFVSFLFSQSLVELAKKEKERRAKLKGKKAIVVTNADLKKLRRGPALSIIESAYEERESLFYPIEKIKEEYFENQALLETEWKRANELVDLLTLRMNELQQTFFSFENLYDRGEMQREIAETYLKLQKARQDAEKAKKELDRQRTKKR